MRVVITGGAGFIGANLARAMTEAGLEVVVVDDLSTGFLSNLEGVDAEFHEGTILDPDLLDKAFARADSIVHLAALPSVPRSIRDPLASHHANATGTLEVLEAVRRHDISHIVVASSSSVYGANLVMPKREDMRPDPLSPYAVSKLATEAYAVAYHHSFGLNVLPFRFFNVFGPLQRAGHAYAAVIPAFIDAALSGRPLPVHGDGTQTRDFTYVGSLVTVVLDAVRRRVASEGPVNLAFGGRTSLNELIEIIEKVVGRALERHTLPPRAGEVPHSQADSNQLLSLFPGVKPVPLEDAVCSSIQWLQNRDDQVHRSAPGRAAREEHCENPGNATRSEGSRAGLSSSR